MQTCIFQSIIGRRTSRCRFHFVRVLRSQYIPSLFIALAAASLLAGTTTANAQTNPDTLVTNLDEDSGLQNYNVGRFSSTHTRRAQGFTTGNNVNGYWLSGIIARIGSQTSGTPVVSIYSADTDGKPNARLYTLNSPSLTANANNTFTAPANATLEKNTTYFVVFFNNTFSNESYSLSGTSSDNETAGSNVGTGWSIENDHRYENTRGTAGWQTNTNALRISIQGFLRAVNATDRGSRWHIADAELRRHTGRGLHTSDKRVFGERGRHWSVSVTSVSVSGNTVTLTLGTAVTNGQTVTVTYTVPSSNPIQDAKGSEVVALDNYPVINLRALASNLDETTDSETFAGISSGLKVVAAQGFTTGDHDYTFSGIIVGFGTAISGSPVVSMHSG